MIFAVYVNCVMKTLYSFFVVKSLPGKHDVPAINSDQEDSVSESLK